MATVPGFLPGLNLVANNQESGGGALDWLRDLLGQGAGSWSYDQLNAVAAQAEPGCGGVVFTPWLAGERSPVDDRAARAGFHNLSLRTTRPQMVRAVMEGVAFNSRWLSEAVEHFVGQRFGPIRAVGGGASSSLWCSLYADILDRPIEQVADPRQANLRGAAILAGLALGRVHPDEVRSLVPVAATHRPDPANRQRYDRLFAEFPAFYSAEKRMFHRLNRTRRSTRRLTIR
jgi:xylulokinase